jgi:DNA repair protein RecN (Recombination protein N)
MIRSLERKDGEGIERILAHASDARAELETITHAAERIRELEGAERDLLERLGKAGAQLSETRRDAGERLRTAIEAELGDLRMEGAEFGVDTRWDPDPAGAPVGEQSWAFSAYGLDNIEFLVAPNPGEGLKPMIKIASGGETSRLMLGLKSVLAQADTTPTLIFDEIDQGIGGRVGAIVGRKLWALARDHQVLCVTHLPQLAAFGDAHIKVEKVTERGRTITLARPLDDSERLPELALMLGGVTDSNLESASDLRRRAVEAQTAPPIST